MRISPPVEPDSRELVDFRCLCVSYKHKYRDAVIQIRKFDEMKKGWRAPLALKD
jgi:hypothetical protein